MAQLTDPDLLARAASDETVWEGFFTDTVVFQRECPDCDKGLLFAPARFCPRCSGDGFLSRTEPRTTQPTPAGQGEGADRG